LRLLLTISTVWPAQRKGDASDWAPGASSLMISRREGTNGSNLAAGAADGLPVARGKRIVKVEPFPGVLLALMVPRC
jgi:hypothetical protein